MCRDDEHYVCIWQAALRAKESGSTRFCMGAAWRGPSQVGKGQWERVLEMVARIRGLGMEVHASSVTSITKLGVVLHAPLYV